ncbi:tyrosine--tRNA ligase [Holospora elegans E1]|uniref:Tyrosine--tRNA ligase n=1 Tax=Holospora elegans E1 TaxID=1427503 RepID=A0A023DY35_9PROT|nr:tyrosine--tRNA ligase [Holospora elegans]GAJ46114.1 tyrosine--tRNA ligase [Holospora elegans E1]
MSFQYKSDLLHTLQQRGFIYQSTHPELLDSAFSSGSVLSYCGFDATAESLHVGNLVALMVARWMQEYGHRPILLLGGGTSKIGDPSWRDTSRPLLTNERIEKNIKGIQRNLRQFLSFDTPCGAYMVNNADWLDNLLYIPFLRDIGIHFSVNRMLSLEHVSSRLEKEEPLSFIEFNYLLLQSYDFLKLYQEYGCTVQFGGSDQWGNIVSGVDLVRRYAKAQVFGLTMPLTTLKDGKKMGKSAQGAIFVDASLCSPYSYWQFWRNVDDEDVIRFLKLYTLVSLEEIQSFSEKDAVNEAKILLADKATALVHGNECLKGIHSMIDGVFHDKSPDTLDLNMPHWNIPADCFSKGVTMVDILERLEFVESRSEARRKISEGAVKIGNQVWGDYGQVLTEKDIPQGWGFVRCGKKYQGWIKRGV